MECRDGELVVPGCDPEKGGASISTTPSTHSGTTLNFTGAQASGPPLTVALEPCGAAAVRMVDAKGKPLQGKHPADPASFCLPARSWPRLVRSDKDDKELEGDWIIWSNFHRGHYVDLKTDAEGRVTIPGLIRGASYQVTSFEAKFDLRKGMTKLPSSASGRARL